MLESARAHLTYANVMATLAVFVAIGGGAVAIGGVVDSNGEVRACYVKKGPNRGDVRLLVKGKCSKSERAINWSQRGPSGAPGAPGQQGPAGEQGPPGAPADAVGAVLAADGPGSGLNADLLDGADSTAFLSTSGGTLTGILNPQAGIRANDGTATTPAYSFLDDSNTGVFSPTANEVSIATGGATGALVSSNGLEIPSGAYLRADVLHGVPPAGDCTNQNDHIGRIAVLSASLAEAPPALYICDSDVSGVAGNQRGWVLVP